jgi:hypothetical protein
MSDNGKYRVVSKHRRGRGEIYEEGDLIEPSDRELELFGDKFAPVEGAGQEPQPEPDEDESDEGGDEDEETQADEEVEDEGDEEDTGEGEALTEERIEEAGYDELRSIASGYDDVSGNQSEDRLRVELLDKIEE